MEYVFGDISIKCSNVDRVMFPDIGITKGELIAYYDDVAAVMVPELRGRPLTLERFTKGIAGGGFFQKHAQKHFPAWIERVELGAKVKVDYPLCDSRAALVYFANQGAVAFHVWTSRKDAPYHPDEIVFDLDPPEGRFDLVIRAAHILRELCDSLELPCFVKSSGSKGLHVVAPVDAADGYDKVDALCGAIARRVCGDHPDLFTTEFYKKDRHGRLFLDTMRNTYGATVVAAYSVRGKPGAPVSAPLTWSEVGGDLEPGRFRLRDIRARLDARGDPWQRLRERAGSATAALDRFRES